jgi:hypothetical protein
MIGLFIFRPNTCDKRFGFGTTLHARHAGNEAGFFNYNFVCAGGSECETVHFAESPYEVIL